MKLICGRTTFMYRGSTPSCCCARFTASHGRCRGTRRQSRFTVFGPSLERVPTQRHRGPAAGSAQRDTGAAWPRGWASARAETGVAIASRSGEDGGSRCFHTLLSQASGTAATVSASCRGAGSRPTRERLARRWRCEGGRPAACRDGRGRTSVPGSCVGSPRRRWCVRSPGVGPVPVTVVTAERVWQAELWPVPVDRACLAVVAGDDRGGRLVGGR